MLANDRACTPLPPRNLQGKEGSTVRVRQRALRKRRTSALSRSGRLTEEALSGGYGARRGAFRSASREQRVVELAADGLSNKEIAARLVVSVHTVEVHLSHAYAKLGVRSRAELARRILSR